ncbi:MAG: hypothetical protein OEN50_00020 [Deltaproteobacteria bacterium]|nr:hypothetical protein [Deltaproteobacteria bacterium]
MKSILLVLAAVFLLGGTTNIGEARDLSASPRVTQNLRGETVLIPRSAPETRDFLLVTYFKIRLDDQFVAIVALYNDPKTRREVDYAEVYQGSGHLLGIAWLDEFGVRRSAVDYGLIGEDSANVTGVLVLVNEGNSI